MHEVIEKQAAVVRKAKTFVKILDGEFDPGSG